MKKAGLNLRGRGEAQSTWKGRGSIYIEMAGLNLHGRAGLNLHERGGAQPTRKGWDSIHVKGAGQGRMENGTRCNPPPYQLNSWIRR